MSELETSDFWVPACVVGSCLPLRHLTSLKGRVGARLRLQCQPRVGASSCGRKAPRRTGTVTKPGLSIASDLHEGIYAVETAPVVRTVVITSFHSSRARHSLSVRSSARRNACVRSVRLPATSGAGAVRKKPPNSGEHLKQNVTRQKSRRMLVTDDAHLGRTACPYSIVWLL